MFHEHLSVQRGLCVQRGFEGVSGGWGGEGVARGVSGGWEVAYPPPPLEIRSTGWNAFTYFTQGLTRCKDFSKNPSTHWKWKQLNFFLLHELLKKQSPTWTLVTVVKWYALTIKKFASTSTRDSRKYFHPRFFSTVRMVPSSVLRHANHVVKIKQSRT